METWPKYWGSKYLVEKPDKSSRGQTFTQPSLFELWRVNPAFVLRDDGGLLSQLSPDIKIAKRT